MAVENNTILKKMINELNMAKENQHNHDTMVRHISNVKVLCDLFIEEERAPAVITKHKVSNEISEEELKAMIGNQGQLKKTAIDDEEEANGGSIFDF
ncbi:hypothetical protein CV093_19200 [Oceanobacillus sp. 143]|uniref:YwdI family protein n=1 Tax=Oceanobacillus zhaokaii TaxID=2052660 RepID=A0A345PKZ3_9BACI|nr:YwdI family protein [Oceanobacillus zhaokaii]AXI10673.1 hypothetical protein CUC15_17755 [Oceanobacillus zhaokaii]QGS69628.1 hypothetical protein CV093_19200 [Oceanobacillus sp. 143]